MKPSAINPRAPWSVQLRQHIQADDIKPLNAPKFCDECLDEEGSDHLELMTGGTRVCLCDDCYKAWEEQGAMFA